MTGIVIENDAGFQSRILYVQPDATVQDALRRGERVPVIAGERVGTAQDVAAYYRAKAKDDPTTSIVPPHVHADWIDPKGRRMHPDGSFYLTP
jgi:hypothetical protein